MLAIVVIAVAARTQEPNHEQNRAKHFRRENNAWKEREGGSNLAEQIHQIQDQKGVEDRIERLFEYCKDSIIELPNHSIGIIIALTHLTRIINWER